MSRAPPLVALPAPVLAEGLLVDVDAASASISTSTPAIRAATASSPVLEPVHDSVPPPAAASNHSEAVVALYSVGLQHHVEGEEEEEDGRALAGTGEESEQRGPGERPAEAIEPPAPAMSSGAEVAYFGNGGASLYHAGGEDGECDSATATLVVRPHSPPDPAPVLAIVLGICATICCCFVCGVPAMLLGWRALQKPGPEARTPKDRQRTIRRNMFGVVLGAIGVACGLVVVLLCLMIWLSQVKPQPCDVSNSTQTNINPDPSGLPCPPPGLACKAIKCRMHSNRCCCESTVGVYKCYIDGLGSWLGSKCKRECLYNFGT